MRCRGVADVYVSANIEQAWRRQQLVPSGHDADP